MNFYTLLKENPEVFDIFPYLARHYQVFQKGKSPKNTYNAYNDGAVLFSTNSDHPGIFNDSYFRDVRTSRLVKKIYRERLLNLIKLESL